MQAGDVITIIGKLNDDWLKGELNGKQGIFPAVLIDHIPPGIPVIEEPTPEEKQVLL